MQFSVKTILTVAIGMATLASAAPAEGLATFDSAGPSAEVSALNDDSALRFRCCAFKGCSVCADYGPIDSCSPCGGVSSTPNVPV
jgi:hypothetical protein